jgi:hypothetical protein
MMLSVVQSVGCLAGETEVLGENLPPVPLCVPQIPHDLICALSRAYALGSQRLTALSYATALKLLR